MSLTVEPPPQASEARQAGFGPRFAVVLLVLLWASQLHGLVGLLSSNAQPQIALHFHTTHISWFTQIGLLVGVFSTPFIIKAAGVFGKKRVLVTITLLGLVGDLIAAVSTNYETLLVGRAIAGFYVPSVALVYALTRDVFPPRLVGPASGFLGGGMGVLALGGTFLSGWVLDDFGFRGALWFMTGATAVSLVALQFLVPESPVREARTPMDWPGGILLGGGLTSFIYGVSQGTEWGWTHSGTVAFMSGGVAAVVVFVLVERRVAHPILPVSLLGRRRVWSTFLVTGLIMGGVFAQGTVLTLLVLMPDIPGLSDGLGWSATKNAAVGAPGSVLLVVVSVITGILVRRIDSRLLLAIGGVVVSVGVALMSQFHHSAGQIMAIAALSSAGMGVIVALIPIMIIESVNSGEQAQANGAQNMAQGVVQALGVQLAFVLVSHNSNTVQGTALYVDGSYTSGFLLMAAVIAIGTVLIALVPKAEHIDQAPFNPPAA